MKAALLNEHGGGSIPHPVSRSSTQPRRAAEPGTSMNIMGKLREAAQHGTCREPVQLGD
jgi:hypothetical protein